MLRIHETHAVLFICETTVTMALICIVVTQVFSGEARNLRGALNEASGVVDDYYYRGKPLSNGTVRLQQ